MKKLSLILMAMMTIVMVGCKPKNPVPPQGGGDATSITLNKTAMTMAKGESADLIATTDPAGCVVTWKSTNEAVATVNTQGRVIAVEEGDAEIVATSGNVTASCKVTVSADQLYDNFKIAGFGLFGSEFEPIAGTDTVLELSDGSIVNCDLEYINWFGWDGDLEHAGNETGWVGDGLFLSGGKVAVYVIKGGQYDGYYIGSRIWTAGYEKDENDVKAYNLLKGHVDPATYGDWLCVVYGEKDKDDVDQELIWSKTGGFYFTEWNVEEDFNYGDYGIFFGFINKMIFIPEDEDEGTDAMFAADVDWSNLTSEDRLWGFQFDLAHYQETNVENEGGEILFVHPYDYAKVHKVFNQELFDRYENPNTDESGRYFIGDQKLLHKEMPIVRGNRLDPTTLHMAR